MELGVGRHESAWLAACRAVAREPVALQWPKSGMNRTMHDPTQDAPASDETVEQHRTDPEQATPSGDPAPAMPAAESPAGADRTGDAPHRTVGSSVERPHSRRSGAGLLGTGLVVLSLGFLGGIGGYFASEEWLADGGADGRGSGAVFQPSNDRATSDEATEASDEETPDTAFESPREIYRDLSPAVAHIDARIVKETTSFFGLPDEQESSGTGSGFIIDEQGHIVTNAHVVEDAKEVTVSLGVDNVSVPAEVVGEDPSSDIAVLKFDPEAEALEGVELSVAEFGDSEALQVGDPVVAIGNPFGLDRTLTTGVVSALQRNIPALNDFSISDVIQTDAAVNPGNSGGPLLNDDGKVIGVNSQIQSRTGNFAGIAFAVPSSTVERVANQLIEKGEVEYAWLGVEGGELTPDLVEQLDLEPGTTGVYISSVGEGTPADRAGIEGGRRLRDLSTGETTVEGGDVLLRFGGEELTSMTQLSGLVAERKPGDKVQIEYLRDGERKTTTVTLGERPRDAAASEDE